MSKYIRIEDAIETAINGCASWDGGYFPSMDDPIKEEFDAVADKCIELVLCRECKKWDRMDCCCMRFFITTSPDFFCAGGKRRTNEHTD